MTDVIDFQEAALMQEWDAVDNSCPVLDRQEDGKLAAFTADVVEWLRNDPAMKAEAARATGEVDDFNIGMSAARATVQWLRNNEEHSYVLEVFILPDALKVAHDPSHLMHELCSGFLSGLSIELAHSTGNQPPTF